MQRFARGLGGFESLLDDLVSNAGMQVLHDGKLAEMRTGEGKTLVAVLPAYLNALEGKGVHVSLNLFSASLHSTEAEKRPSSCHSQAMPRTRSLSWTEECLPFCTDWKHWKI